ncbi:IclR family transcriptional regulator [Leucobacter denitrificans]|uniref:IclR family transcriptional regulator n=1 Tax=Leucobacter denitrificans TaxID=683042 RepID=A0A7G9S6I7_9MICO|nr:IclR family transcriptional regulator [Leucobacter denitrificans]QNN63462.1 IclR family transcriptional regulator [Leucobacter denitrificans]
MSVPKVPAADQSLRILSLLARSRGPVPASIIASQLELPRSSVYQLLATMQEHGFVMHLPEERRYGLGIAAVELSLAYEKQEPLARLGRPLIAHLVDRMGLSGHLAVPSGNEVLYVIEERAHGAPSLVTDVDVRLPMHLTASGRAVLAALPKAQVRALYPNEQAFTHRLENERSIDRYSKLRTVLDDTVTRGFAVERGSVTAGFSSVASAVLDHRSWPVAAIALTFRDEDIPESEYGEIAAEVRAVAETLTDRIHGRRSTPRE